MRRDKEEISEKPGAYPLRYVRNFSLIPDAVATHRSFAAVAFNFATRS